MDKPHSNSRPKTVPCLDLCYLKPFIRMPDEGVHGRLFTSEFSLHRIAGAAMRVDLLHDVPGILTGRGATHLAT